MSPAPRREGTPARHRKSRKGGVVWAPPVDAVEDDGEPIETTGLRPKTGVRPPKRTRTGLPVRRRRRLARTFMGYASSLGGMVVIAVVVLLAIAVFRDYGPFAAPPPLTAAEKADLAARYQSMVTVTNDKESTLNVQLGNYEMACQSGSCPSISQFRDIMSQYYDAENEFLTNLKAIDWKGARTQANAVIDAVTAELKDLDRLRNVGSESALSTILPQWSGSGGSREAVQNAVTAFRSVLGIPLATPSPQPPALPTCTPEASGSPAASGSPGASGSAGASASAAGSPSAAPSALPSASGAASGSPAASATPAASPTACATVLPSPGASPSPSPSGSAAASSGSPEASPSK